MDNQLGLEVSCNQKRKKRSKGKFHNVFLDLTNRTYQARIVRDTFGKKAVQAYYHIHKERYRVHDAEKKTLATLKEKLEEIEDETN